MRVVGIGLSLLALVLAGCNGSNGAGPPAGGSGTLALAGADRPATTPCPSQDILTDAMELMALKDALTNGTITHLDVPYNAADADIFKKKAGLDGFWDPGAAVNEVLPVVTPVTLASLVQSENAGIAAAGFTSASFGTGEGFPVAGTYRKEFKVAYLATTYLLRVRAIVGGSVAGRTFASESITVPDDIANTLVYELNGTATTHADLIADAIALLGVSADDAPTFTLTVRKTMGGPVVFTAVVELICVEKL